MLKDDSEYHLITDDFSVHHGSSSTSISAARATLNSPYNTVYTGEVERIQMLGVYHMHGISFMLNSE